jgi:hypothetical protein
MSDSFHKQLGTTLFRSAEQPLNAQQASTAHLEQLDPVLARLVITALLELVILDSLLAQLALMAKQSN